MWWSKDHFHISFQFCGGYHLFVAVVCFRVDNPSSHGHCFPFLCSCLFVFICILLFWTSQQGMGCQTTCLLQKLLHLVRSYYCVIGRANSPCCFGEKFNNVTLNDCFSHVIFGCAKHCHDYLMHPLQYCVCLWVLDTGWLMLQIIWITVVPKWSLNSLPLL